MSRLANNSGLMDGAAGGAPTPVDLWTIAQEEESKSLDYKNYERTVMIVGEKGCGKTSLINLLKGRKEEEPKPTSALDYSFAARSNNNRKEIVHIYELGGGRLLQNLVSIPLNAQSLKSFVYIIVLDLSEPSTVLESLMFWMTIIKEKTERALSEIAAQGNKDLIYEFKNFSLSRIEGHQDAGKLNPCSIPVMVLANKYDVFEATDGENRKWMSKILRQYCHVNGASLFYSSVSHPKLSLQIRSVLNSFFFAGSLGNFLQTDHMKPVFATFGADAFESIGVATASNISSIDLLKKLSKDYFPPNPDAKPSKNDGTQLDFSRYPEAKIDSMRAEKDKEMEKYLKAKEEEDRKESPEKPIISSSAVRRTDTSNLQGYDSPGQPEYRPAPAPAVKRFRPQSGNRQPNS